LFCDIIAEQLHFFAKEIPLMFNQNTISFRLFNLILITAFCFGFVLAQDKKDDDDNSDATQVDAPQLVVKAVGNGSSDGSGLYRVEDDDSKVTGATVRGRLIYEDTTRPVRYVMITLVSDKETYTSYTAKFVKTDANGEFVIRNVKAGTYVAYVKSEGILNQDSYKFSYRQPTKENKTEEKFEKIEISGLGEFQIVVAARRGAAVTGRIFYADGEAAVGVKVEALRKEGNFYSNTTSRYGSESSVGVAQTDDRGFYRIAGLPEGQYIIRVIEPVSHNQSAPQYTYNYRDNQESILRTYYPEGETSKGAKELDILPGQEQAGIDITLPERQLFDISGKILKKRSREPLSNFTISFYKITERDDLVTEYSISSSGAASNKAGEWFLKNLPKGKYRISISPGYVYNSKTDANKKPEQYPNMSKEIEITDKNLADLNFEVPAEANITGTIVAEGGREVPTDVRLYAISEDVKKQVYDYSQYQSLPQQAAKEMGFRIGKLSEGSYRLVTFNTQNYYLKSITLGGRDLLNSSFEVREGEEIKGVQVVVSTNMGTVKGKIAGYDGTQEVFVGAIRTDAVFEQIQSKSFSGRVQPTGDFEIKTAPGEYAVVLVTLKNRPQNEAEAKEWFEKLLREGQKVSVKDGETTNVSLSMPK
jgi:5-hydroxyisourate hydrolase-like protein (transthyretin family)